MHNRVVDCAPMHPRLLNFYDTHHNSNQRTAELATKDDVRRISAKLHTIHSAVAETAEDYEHRIHHLEQRTA